MADKCPWCGAARLPDGWFLEFRCGSQLARTPEPEIYRRTRGKLCLYIEVRRLRERLRTDEAEVLRLAPFREAASVAESIIADAAQVNWHLISHLLRTHAKRSLAIDCERIGEKAREFSREQARREAERGEGGTIDEILEELP